MPKKQQQKAIPKLSNIFEDDNASDDDDGTDWVRKALKAEGEKNKMKKQTKLDIQKALNEDPTIYQYDEVYDDMERTKSQLDTNKHKEKKARYIENLLKTAERRKKEQEHRIERMVQKEREAEGEMYADKESFVTSAYRTKLEEFKKMQEEEDRMSRLEAIGDVTKQQDMSGFYRHLYQQTVNYQVQDKTDNNENETKEKNVEQEQGNLTSTSETRENSTDDGSKTILKSKRLRQYRQRAMDTYESDSENEPSKVELKEDQICAPADKDTDKLEMQESVKKKQKPNTEDVKTNKCITVTTNQGTQIKNIEIHQDNKKVTLENEKVSSEEKSVEKDKSSIWEKRTVGPIFEAALQRYYARKAMKLAVV